MTADHTPRPDANIYIQISGDEGTRFAAEWVITSADGVVNRFEHEGSIPVTYAYMGEAISGTVTQLSEGGRLLVEIRNNGNRSLSSTQGKGSVLKTTVN